MNFMKPKRMTKFDKSQNIHHNCSSGIKDCTNEHTQSDNDSQTKHDTPIQDFSQGNSKPKNERISISKQKRPRILRPPTFKLKTHPEEFYYEQLMIYVPFREQNTYKNLQQDYSDNIGCIKEEREKVFPFYDEAEKIETISHTFPGLQSD
ncbi:unnamed protein product [Owenia fusiformis]|uniref:Uncharacterized protein n=1 Tax=Owenia fusiformis TaxID=6347 RepID=A0A8S4P8C0_OWEFU|nr:unnamed protein product [Owenia fusiformis]